MPSFFFKSKFIINNAKNSVNNLWLFYFLIVKRHWDVYSLVQLRKYCKFSKLFMYLKRVPAISGCALLWWVMSWRHGGPGGCNSSFSSSTFHWEIAMSKLKKEFVRLCISQIEGKGQYKKILLHFQFIILFQKICRVVS